MNAKSPKAGLNILILKNKQVLLGLLTKKWLYHGKQVFGVPGRDLHFKETIGNGVKRNIKDELGVAVTTYEIISVNANYEYGNHYIGIGVVAKIKGEIKHLKKEDWEKWQWFDINQIPDNLFPDAKNPIKCYLENKVCVAY